MLGADSRGTAATVCGEVGHVMSSSSVGVSSLGDPFGRQSPASRAGVAQRLVPETAGGPGLDPLARLAATLTGAPCAQVSLVSDVEHVVAGHGLPAGTVGSEVPLDQSLAAVTVAQGSVLDVSRAATDERVRGLAPVTRGIVGAYAGVPLLAEDGVPVGALAVFGPTPREWSPSEVEMLRHLAGAVVAELRLQAMSSDYDADRIVWQLAVDAAGVGAFDWDISTGRLDWDERLMELFGYDAATFTMDLKAFNDRVHPDDLPRVTHAFETALETCGEYAAEYRVVLPDGEVRWVAARGRALCGDDGTAERLIGAAYDTTHVHEGEARVARVLESMSSAFYSLDAEWRFTYVNAEAERILRRPRHELVGQNIWELYPAGVGGEFDLRYREAVETGETVTFEAHLPEPLNGWFEVRAWPMPEGLSVYFLEITERRLAQEQLERAARRSELLARISGELTSTLDAEEAVAQLTRMLVPALGDWSMVTLVEGRGDDWRRRLRDLGFWHADPEMLPLLERYNEIKLDAAYDSDLVQQAMSDDAATIVIEDSAPLIEQVLRPGEARELVRRLDPGPAISIPLRGRGRLMGMLSLHRRAGRPPFDQHEVELLEDVAARAGLALDNARLFAQQRDLAEGLQRSLLTEPPRSDQVEVVVRYQPAAEAAQVGGDWYDSFLLPDGSVAMVIGDVVGHDTAAAAAMGQVRSLLRGIAVHGGGGPAEVLRGVDHAMRTLSLEATATVVLAKLQRVERASGGHGFRLTWCNAGHPPPFLIAAHEPCAELAAGDPDLLLGLEPDTRRSERTMELTPGSTVLLYTDGLVERREQSLDTGVAQLRQTLDELVLEGLGLEEMCDGVLQRLVPSRSEDDVALVAVRLR